MIRIFLAALALVCWSVTAFAYPSPSNLNVISDAPILAEPDVVWGHNSPANAEVHAGVTTSASTFYPVYEPQAPGSYENFTAAYTYVQAMSGVAVITFYCPNINAQGGGSFSVTLDSTGSTARTYFDLNFACTYMTIAATTGTTDVLRIQY